MSELRLWVYRERHPDNHTIARPWWAAIADGTPESGDIETLVGWFGTRDDALAAGCVALRDCPPDPAQPMTISDAEMPEVAASRRRLRATVERIKADAHKVGYAQGRRDALVEAERRIEAAACGCGGDAIRHTVGAEPGCPVHGYGTTVEWRYIRVALRAEVGTTEEAGR